MVLFLGRDHELDRRKHFTEDLHSYGYIWNLSSQHGQFQKWVYLVFLPVAYSETAKFEENTKCYRRRIQWRSQISLDERYLDSCGCRGRNEGDHCRGVQHHIQHKARACLVKFELISIQQTLSMMATFILSATPFDWGQYLSVISLLIPSWRRKSYSTFVFQSLAPSFLREINYGWVLRCSFVMSSSAAAENSDRNFSVSIKGFLDDSWLKRR